VLDEFVGDLDPETRWAMIWYRDHGFDEGTFDDAEKINKTVVTSLDNLQRAGIAVGRASRVVLVHREQMPEDWSPATDSYVTVWEVTQHLVHRLTTRGEDAAGDLLRECRRWADDARNLAYWLSQTASMKRPAEALDYEALVTSWVELSRRADQKLFGSAETVEQPSLRPEESSS
jgi:putative DNA methylase